MAKPAFIRYLPARLKPLSNPAVWVPLTAFALLGAFAWEYYHNPDWFDRDPISSVTPNSALTPEEEAQLSEIGTLDVLLSGSRAPAGTAVVTSQINPDAPDRENRAAEDDAEGLQRNSSGVDSEAYPIPGAASTTALTPERSSVYSDPTQPTTRATGSSASSFDYNFGDGLANTPSVPATSSALAEALARRDAALSDIERPAIERPAIERPAGAAVSASSPAGNQIGRQFGDDNSLATDPATNSAANPSANPSTVEALPPANAVPGSFIRTTPNMSPPVGTTGYQVPATSQLPTFNIAPQQPTRYPYSLPAATGANPFAVPNASVAPAVAPVVTPVVPAAAPTVGNQRSSAPSSLYTQPSSVQPDQGPVINPRR